MTLSPAQLTALRLGAALSLVAAVILMVAAITIDTEQPGAETLISVEDPSAIALPDPALFGSDVVLYGVADRAGVPAVDLGCRLVSRQGNELSSAKLVHLSVLSSPSVVFDGTELRPLFVVNGYPDGAQVVCTDADSAAPLALSAPSTFGAQAGLVRATAAGGALVFLVVAVAGWIAFRPRPRR